MEETRKMERLEEVKRLEVEEKWEGVEEEDGNDIWWRRKCRRRKEEKEKL